MAPKRKNKKPASNPARGFATTSTASKAKAPNEIAAEDTISEIVLDGNGYVQQPRNKDAPADKELHQLSPEELEKQLEESDLNLFLETNSEKVKRDVARQVNKLQTEKRLVRIQAEVLHTRFWLPPEIVELILDAVLVDQSIERQDHKILGVSKNDGLSEDDLSLKLWTLKQVLVQLGFPYGLCQEALQYLLPMLQEPTVRERLVGKDGIWGLDCCLDWMALHCTSQQAPSYLPCQEKTDVMPILEQDPGASLQFEKADSVSVSPGSAMSRPSQPSSCSNEFEGGASLCAGTTPITTDSDIESDMDPDTMTDRYIELRTRLYQIKPDSGEERKPQNLLTDRTQPPQVSKLLRRLEQLQSDILFDRYEAEQKWTEKRNQLAQATAQRRKLQLDDANRSGGGFSSKQKAETTTSDSVCETSDEDEEDGGVGALGDFFSGLQDTTFLDNHGTLKSNGEDASRPLLTVRDFGKWTGISPRRVLEEACKARDSSARVTYQLVDRSPFAKQQFIDIYWSRNQPLPTTPPTQAISCAADARRVRIEMRTEATPDAIQAESYVSTTALFLIFSSVPKEEKASLRLPSTWKGLWSELSDLKRQRDMAADRDELRGVRSLIEEASHKNPVASPAPPAVPSNPSPAETNSISARTDPPQGPKPFQDPKAIWSSKSVSPSFNRMLHQRKTLPIWDFKDEILRSINERQVVIVCGETGCGKSTQVPSYILEHELSLGNACKIYCTEPRRISAISLARRVSEELGERKSDVGTFRSLVGYAIRLESKLVRETRLVYATTGIVMRMLESSDDLHEITHLVLDEVHERSIESDFLLIILRKLLIGRPKLKVVLMSATVDAAKFSKYFGGAPIMTVPGRTFPVDTKYLEDVLEETGFTNHDRQRLASVDDYDQDDTANHKQRAKDGDNALVAYSPRTRSTLASFDEYRVNYELIVALLEAIATKPKFVGFSKAVLVFLPGIAEIRRLNDILTSHGSFSSGWYIHALHSSIAMDEQERAFAIPPTGHRKIVLATNIAETGVTIPDVTCVIDTGKHKEMRFDERRQLSRLIEVFISRANAKQRRGRAGRVQKGLCFHLFTRERHDDSMAEEQTPEILRLSLQDLVLRVKICGLGSIEQTLSEALDAPLVKNIRRAIDALVDVKALTVAEDLTPLGRQLAKLPLDVFLGKLILLGCIYKCLDGALTMAAILSSKSPFSAPLGAKSKAEQARLAFRKGDSDLLTVYNAYCSWRRTCNASGASEQQFCRKHYLSQQNLMSIEELKGQLTTCLVDAGFLELKEGESISLNKVRSWSSKRTFVEIPSRYNANATDLTLNSVICWSFYPKVLRREGKGWRNVANNQSVSLHPSSVNQGVEQTPQWLSFYHIMQSSNKFYNAHETSAVEPFALVLACGEADFKMYSGVIVIDGNRIKFSVDDWKLMLAIKMLRHKLRQISAQIFRHPGRQLSTRQQVWLDIWEKVFAYHDEKMSGTKT